MRRVRGAEIDQGNRLPDSDPNPASPQVFSRRTDDHGAAWRTEHRVQRTPRRRVIEIILNASVLIELKSSTSTWLATGDPSVACGSALKRSAGC